jgi:hypothetical protein
MVNKPKSISDMFKSGLTVTQIIDQLLERELPPGASVSSLYSAEDVDSISPEQLNNLNTECLKRIGVIKTQLEAELKEIDSERQEIEKRLKELK